MEFQKSFTQKNEVYLISRYHLMILNQLLHQTIKELLPIDSSFAEKESQLEVSRAYGFYSYAST